MRQLTFLGPGKLEWRDVPDPTIQTPRDAMLRPIAVATCDLDGAVIRGRAALPGPYPFGHECSPRSWTWAMRLRLCGAATMWSALSRSRAESASVAGVA